MTYKQKVTKIGNSYGVIIPKELREAISLQENNEVSLIKSSDGKSIIITAGAPSVDEGFYSLLQEVQGEYSEALAELADK
ncbi:MAG: putative addiction module antidote [Planctomycetota bacterium]|jgi:putative addiction module antidote